ncbi:putative metal-dependent hydrolase [Bryobacterales bacterium F-183]|nr:putative metal-dependent hydrolase [Bryobacterales bacterium F-183]
MSDPRYPIGPFAFPAEVSEANYSTWIEDIASLPANLKLATDGLSDAQLDTPYRDGGWTVRQLVHHVADSHINSYIRFKLAATEDSPLIPTYEEQLWAELSDGKWLPILVSLDLLRALHERWVVFLKALPASAWTERSFRHPVNGVVPLGKALALYSWHGRHHTAHVTALRHLKGW